MIELSLILIDIFASSYPHRRGGARYSICRYGNTLVARFSSVTRSFSRDHFATLFNIRILRFRIRAI